MGGRGASSGISKLSKDGTRGGNRYGSQYKTILKERNIKFLVPRTLERPETLMETMTRGRVYVLMNHDATEPKSIVYFDSSNKRSKQIDLDDRHGGVAHVHRGYKHNEYNPRNLPTKLNDKEKRMVARVNSIWENHRSKS